MKLSNQYASFMLMLFFLFEILVFDGCDSGKKVIDQATGKQDVKQYQQMKKDIGKISDQQAERYNQISDNKKN